MPEPRSFVRLTRDALSETDVTRFVTTPASGGVVLFSGVVRDHHEGRSVVRIDYRGVEALARVKLAEIAEEPLSDARIHRTAAFHRLGVLEVGDVSVMVAASASHREEAFRAARHLIDRIKQVLPVWKLEHFADGTMEWAPGFTIPDSDRAGSREARRC